MKQQFRKPQREVLTEAQWNVWVGIIRLLRRLKCAFLSPAPSIAAAGVNKLDRKKIIPNKQT